MGKREPETRIESRDGLSPRVTPCRINRTFKPTGRVQPAGKKELFARGFPGATVRRGKREYAAGRRIVRAGGDFFRRRPGPAGAVAFRQE